MGYILIEEIIMAKILTPLNYQSSEFDCVPVNFLNAIIYLTGRTGMKPDMLQYIQTHGNDLVDYLHIIQPGKKLLKEKTNNGTSTKMIKRICKYLDRFRENGLDPFIAKYFDKEQVTLTRLQNEVNAGSIALVNIELDQIRHFLMITKTTARYAFAFDTYYKPDAFLNVTGVIPIHNRPFAYNRRILLKRLFSETLQDYSMGPSRYRQMVIIQNQGESNAI